MTKAKRGAAKPPEPHTTEEPPRVARIWTELDGDDLQRLARRAADEQLPMLASH